MRRWVIDFETYWAQDYSLKFMTPPEYIASERFEALGAGIVDPDNNAYWVDGPDLRHAFQSIDWSNAMVLSHNALFDMLILSMRYARHAAYYVDTLAMARNWVSHATGKADLATCAAYYGLPPKGTTTNKFKGLNFAAIKAIPDLYNEMCEYGIHDAELCGAIFAKMMGAGFPVSELDVIDSVVRMAAEPVFRLDQDILVQHLADVRAKKAALIAEAGIGEDNVSSLMSNQQLAAKLLMLGVDPIPMKFSKTTGRETFAFAKSDRAFTDLLEHDEPLVQALVAARLGVKSTLEETRTERMIAIARTGQAMPVPLKYSGAHTHRFSGDWKINLQNLPNGSPLRSALKVPEGKVVISVDASQIEARINACLSGQTDLIEGFRKGEDVYASFAQDLYGYPIDKNRNKKERFVGKTGILSLGYGSSWPVFQNMCRVKGDVVLTDSEAAIAVQHYRRKYNLIEANWQYANTSVLNAVATGIPIEWGPVIVGHYFIKLPNGNYLRYNDLRYEWDDMRNKMAWTYRRGALRQHIYGAKLVENIVQALAFVFITDVAREVRKLTNGSYLMAHQVHDELIYVTDEEYAEPLKRLLLKLMSTPPKWMPVLPVAAEGRIGQSYGELKS